MQTIVVTTSMVRLGESAVARLAPSRAPAEPAAAPLPSSAWAAYGFGAAGAIGAQHIIERPLFGAAAVLFIVAADAADARLA